MAWKLQMDIIDLMTAVEIQPRMLSAVLAKLLLVSVKMAGGVMPKNVLLIQEDDNTGTTTLCVNVDVGQIH